MNRYKNETNKNVLFIGNSITYVNDIPKLVEGIARANDIAIYCDSITIGGRFLDDIYKIENQNILETLNTKQYHYLILQEQSYGSFLHYDRFLDAVVAFNNLAKKHDLEVILYQTWPYRDNSDYLKQVGGLTQKQMIDLITESYDKAANEINCEISRVGEVFYSFSQTHPDIVLYDDDNHASLEGSYLASCVHFISMFGESVVGNSFGVNLDKKTKLLIQTYVSDFFDF